MTLRSLLAVAFLVTVHALPSAARSAEPWKLATLIPLTGTNAGFSLELKNGFEIAVDEINRRGGINGRPVSLTFLDTQSNSGQVATLIRQACSDALIVVGPAFSAEARVAFPVAASLQCPAIAPAAAATGLTVNARPWAFSFITSVDQLTPGAIDQLARVVKPKRAVLIIEKADNSALEQGERSGKALAGKGVQVETINVAATDVDFGPVVTRTAASNPDVIVVSTMGDRASSGLLKEFRKAQQRAAIVLTQSTYNTPIEALGPTILENVYRYAEADPPSSNHPHKAAFMKEYEARAGRAAVLTGFLTYDTMMLVKDVIESAGLKGDAGSRAADRKKFVERLGAIRDWEGLAGTRTMSPQGFMLKTPVLLQYHGGKWDHVKAD